MTTQPTQEAPSSDVVEAQDKRRRALEERLLTIADLCVGTPLEGPCGDVAYDLLRQAAAQIASDRLRLAALASTAGDTLKAENERLREALTPSGGTKAAYMGEFSFTEPYFDDEGEEHYRKVYVPWTTIKEIMAFILARADDRTALGSDQ